ncbi:hypothetical protein LJ739_07145 [Aestuariibacter halophilus]|uniref:Peptidylprolyl isomerase n=1 Tax=Fluctibacter halophilus TaxID=226011 RepID=A0ABS8G672_9ALTE|nr:hypothetical protein [Aestuariibacter halophilus]MCC2616013.1 hypothetical protein [Aestuariibacter halophilus]
MKNVRKISLGSVFAILFSQGALAAPETLTAVHIHSILQDGLQTELQQIEAVDLHQDLYKELQNLDLQLQTREMVAMVSREITEQGFDTTQAE